MDVGQFCEFNWGNGFETFKLVKIETMADGNCFFHALVNGFYVPYRTGILNGNKINKFQIVTGLRSNLAEKLGSPVDPNDPNSQIHYDILSHGNLRSFGESINEYTLGSMMKRLHGCVPVGMEFNEFISNQISKDIYLLDSGHQDVYVIDSDLDLLYKGRNSVVIMATPGHYELVGLQDENGISTHFNPNHPFIKFLYERLRIKTGKND